ncbi:MerR family transcriptional regulator [Ottowia testudinis]|uniref:MerR family transcriptional regulator n=1 Tax=Ottowia testudinis TaxID=2816950 RepID=A0A975H3X6_9BURK|nr:MerR family transcriptional regulator [Ottowia testudinis]QTD46264.1 MerR family transcriptional regulator [Ottowia testudinis]
MLSNAPVFKIGELAQRAGLSVRALHHYDAIGLLSPSARTASGARRYAGEDLVRLHRIQALKQWGLPLADIRALLNDAGTDVLRTLQQHICRLKAEARKARTLAKGLQVLSKQLAQGEQPAPEDWLNALEMMALYRQHFTPDELQTLRPPKQSDAEWAELIGEVTQALADDLAPESARAQALSWRWLRMVIAKTGNQAGLEIKLRKLQTHEGRAQAIVGITLRMMAWVMQAMAHARLTLFARYLTPAQTAALQERLLCATTTDADAWPGLLARVHEQWQAGTPVQAEPMQQLAREWQALFRAHYCGDDADLHARLRHALAQEPDLTLCVGMSPQLLAYIRAAMAHAEAHQSTNHRSTPHAPISDITCTPTAARNRPLPARRAARGKAV